MSSTNRGGERAEADFYPTPTFAVRRLLEAAYFPLWEGRQKARWLELGAGDGAIIRAVNATTLIPPEWTAVEFRPECAPILEETGARVLITTAGDFAIRCAESGERFDVCMMNPPFSQALAFVKAALAVADVVACLERSPWIGDSEERFEFFRSTMPDDEYRVGRIDFNGNGGDSIPYSWFVWGTGALARANRTTSLHLLNRTPSTERVRGTLPPARQLGLDIGDAQ